MQAHEPEPVAPVAPGADWPPEPGPPAAAPEAAPAPRRSRSRLWVAIRDFAEAVVLAGLLFFGLQLVMQNTVVKGVSMEPNYVSEQRVIVNKLAYRFGQPARGDVIVFHAPGLQEEDFIKRIVALPGESVAVLDGVVYVNGKALDEPYGPVQDPYSFGPYTVPEGHYFVMGDNRPNSNDSRTWATGGQALPRERIVGPVLLSVWPPEAWGLAASDAPGPAQRGARAESP
jgi:signal peptidase I